MLKTKLGKAVPYCLCTAMLSTFFSYGAGNAVSDTQLIYKPTPSLITMPQVKLNPSGKDYVATYIRRHGAMLEEIYQARGSYFKTIDKIFTERDIPVELKYLAVIESKLKTNALSKVGAKGMWQFMPTTARWMGLTVNSRVDERTYAYKSTVAAAKYLQILYDMFDDWLLTIAAYNSGPGHVLKAIKKSGSRNFWKLQNYLPQETRLHVKKFIATHYYFEGGGSLVTLTKAERLQHLEAMAKFNKQFENENDNKSDTTSSNYFHWVAVINEEKGLSIVLKK